MNGDKSSDVRRPLNFAFYSPTSEQSPIVPFRNRIGRSFRAHRLRLRTYFYRCRRGEHLVAPIAQRFAGSCKLCLSFANIYESPSADSDSRDLFFIGHMRVRGYIGIRERDVGFFSLLFLI